MIYKISELDKAIDEVLGADEVGQLRNPPIRMHRTRLHQYACLRAFEKKLEGNSVEVLRVMLVYINEYGTYPDDSWDI